MSLPEAVAPDRPAQQVEDGYSPSKRRHAEAATDVYAGRAQLSLQDGFGRDQHTVARGRSKRSIELGDAIVR